MISTNALAAEKLTILYIERPPFFTTNKDQLSGLIAEIVDAIGKSSNITLDYSKINSWKSVLQLLKKPVNACYAGSYFTEKRAKIYQYSNPIYTEPPYVVITHKNIKKQLGNTIAIDTLLASKYTMGHIDGFSYGSIVDNKIKVLNTPKAKLSYLTKNDQKGSYRNIFELIKHKRIDYYLMNPLELSWFISEHPNLAKSIEVITLEKSLKANNRYIMCSKDVKQTVLDQINNGLDNVKKNRKYQEIITRYHTNTY
ncbi:substrate-binding periplasmic protein [Thalassotalea ganghwensis]